MAGERGDAQDLGRNESRGRLSGFNRDYYGGGLLILLGLYAVVQGIHYDVGSLVEMGPGFFPASLGTLLLVLGVIIALGARSKAPSREVAKLPPEWRGWLCIMAGIASFIVLGRYGGLLPATFAVVFISALGDRNNTFKAAFILALSICVVSVVVFWWALQLQFPLFAWG
jgi:Tripartite tricarboxylate transporter TctB family